jgi:hypothetical protein
MYPINKPRGPQAGAWGMLIKKLIRNVRPLAVFAFVLWMGYTGARLHDPLAIGLLCLVTAVAVTMLVEHILRPKGGGDE